MITLFTTDCPRCRVLEKKLQAKGIDFTENHDVTEVVEHGFISAPVLKVDGKYMDFAKANQYINTL